MHNEPPPVGLWASQYVSRARDTYLVGSREWSPGNRFPHASCHLRNGRIKQGAKLGAFSSRPSCQQGKILTHSLVLSLLQLLVLVSSFHSTSRRRLPPSIHNIRTSCTFALRFLATVATNKALTNMKRGDQRGRTTRYLYTARKACSLQFHFRHAIG